MEEVLKNWGAAGLFLGFMFSSMGIPVPLPLLLGLIYAAKQAYGLSFVPASFLVFTGSYAGDVAAYLIFNRLGRPLLNRIVSKNSFNKNAFLKIENWYDKYGVLSIILLRWVSWGKAQAVWLCGLSKMSTIYFLVVVLLAELPWALFWVFAVYKLTRLIDKLFSWV